MWPEIFIVSKNTADNYELPSQNVEKNVLTPIFFTKQSKHNCTPSEFNFLSFAEPTQA